VLSVASEIKSLYLWGSSTKGDLGAGAFHRAFWLLSITSRLREVFAKQKFGENSQDFSS